MIEACNHKNAARRSSLMNSFGYCHRNSVSEIKMINGTPTYVRTVDVGRPIGTVRQSNGGGSTSNLYVQTDSAGNLITAFPIP